MKFPQDYPYSPPSIRFVTKVWHPNVYENGDLCISILHQPVEDSTSGELPCERWNPTQVNFKINNQIFPFNLQNWNFSMIF
jgi:ubiquitin-conjugating enzyme E2 R